MRKFHWSYIHRISQFLFHEASLLDDWKFRDWLAQLDRRDSLHHAHHG
ncbi:hypothetical protein ACLK1X_14280 [Escherichia coli]